MSDSCSSRYSRRAKRKSRRQLFFEARNDPATLSGTEYLQRARESSLESLSSAASRFSLNCPPTPVECNHQSSPADDELDSLSNQEPPNDDAAEYYFADNDEGPTDESSTVVSSSQGSAAPNINYIHFEQEISHLVAASIISNIMQPLTDEQNQRYRKAVYGNGGANDAMVTRKGTTLSRATIQRLQPATWLNDELINFHNRIILSDLYDKLCSAIPGRKRCYFLSPYFIPTLIDEKHLNRRVRGKFNYNNVKGWANKATCVKGALFDLAYLFVPYNIRNEHWTLVVVAFAHNKIVYYDSFHAERQDIVNHVIDYLRMHFQDITGSVEGFPEWEVIMQPTGYEFTAHYSNYPSQTNGEY